MPSACWIGLQICLPKRPGQVEEVESIEQQHRLGHPTARGRRTDGETRTERCVCTLSSTSIGCRASGCMLAAAALAASRQHSCSCNGPASAHAIGTFATHPTQARLWYNGPRSCCYSPKQRHTSQIETRVAWAHAVRSNYNTSARVPSPPRGGMDSQPVAAAIWCMIAQAGRTAG